MAIIIKSRAEIAIMREAGRINARALDSMSRAVRPGITTAELNEIAEQVIRSDGATPVFLNYPNASHPGHPYPATINASINDELVHGIPGRRALKEGDIISLDCGCTYSGFVGDAAITVGVGHISAEAARLIQVTREALDMGIAASRAGTHLGDVSATIEEQAVRNGYCVVREYTGHGVGRSMHEDPQIANWGKRGAGTILRPGMTFALEPMIIVGNPRVYVKHDLWTVATRDHSLCAHFEHTIAVTDGEPEILTML
jgi:methionyl aminopeptidase